MKQICNTCKLPKEMEEFPRVKRAITGRGCKCTSCVNESRKGKREQVAEEKKKYGIFF